MGQVLNNIAQVALIHLSINSQIEINTTSMLLQYSRATVDSLPKNFNISNGQIEMPSLCNLIDSKDDCSKKTFLQQVSKI